METVTSATAFLTNTSPATLDSSVNRAKGNPEANVSVTGVTYNFNIVTKNDIPVGGFMKLKFPSGIGVPSASVITIKCN